MSGTGTLPSGGQPVPGAVVCTRNSHKVEELAKLLPELKLLTLPAGIDLPPETGTTFLDNARIKARAGQDAMGGKAWVLADDSGLCVEALGGAPGVHSARFAGEPTDDQRNNELLLKRLEGHADRSAAFVCVLVAIAPDGGELVAEGRVSGSIAAMPRGESGFGYDPLFVPDGEEQTFAELGSETKQLLSHRARAAHELASLLAAASAPA